MFYKGAIIDTIHKNDSFLLSGIKASTYKMGEKTYPVNNEVKIQGAAGSEAAITLFEADELATLRDQNLLINDASLTFYINNHILNNFFFGIYEKPDILQHFVNRSDTGSCNDNQTFMVKMSSSSIISLR